MAQNERLIVSGASGKLATLILKELAAKHVPNVIATTRTPEKLTEFASQGIEVRQADFKDPSSLSEAFKGGTRLLLISTSDVGTRVPQHAAAIDAAKSAGIKHIIYTTWPKASHSVAKVSPDHAATEKLILESGLKYTFLANYSYSEILLFSLPKALEGGKYIGAAGDGKAAYITRQDCAYAAAAVLSNAEKHENKSYGISGPRAYSRKEIAELASQITGKKLEYVDLPAEEFKAALVQSGMPEGFADLFLSFELAIKAGELATVTQDVEQISGHQPISLQTFLQSSLKP